MILLIDNYDSFSYNLVQMAGRYHSLVAVRETVPNVLQVIGEDKNGEVMAVQHKTYPVYGMQFHPESILTPQGRIILENFLNL